MSYQTSQATSNDWLSGNKGARLSSRNFIELMTVTISESRLPVELRQDWSHEAGGLSSELRTWDLLSDEALINFEKSL